jgi:methylmalonyl-CoA/ethylmalonyl-CoA epimerase
MIVGELTFLFHHVGIVTGHLDQSVAFYTTLGYHPSQTFSDPIQKAEIVLLHRQDSPTIEVIHPIDVDSPAAGWLKRIQGGPYHTCFQVTDLDGAIKRLRAERLVIAAPPAPAIAFAMRLVCFLWSQKSGLIELLEASRTSETGLR